MNIRFQYNKISLQQMQQQLKVRLDALPVLKFKETILRSETEKIKKEQAELEERLALKIKEYSDMDVLWQEFPLYTIAIKGIKTLTKNIAGIKVLQLEKVDFEQQPVYLFTQPAWITDGMYILKDLTTLAIEREILSQTADMLEKARKKTTQKVNLYEKVQAPGYSAAIAKITKYLNDEEALDKAMQKIVKNKLLPL